MGRCLFTPDLRMGTDSASEYTPKQLHHKEKQRRCSPEAGGAEGSACHLMLSEAAENLSAPSMV